MSALFDPGLQPERTALAWRRTCLSAAIGAAVLTRLVANTEGVLAIAIGLCTLVATAVAYLYGERRYRTNERALADGRPLADGRALATATVAVALLGGLCVAYLVGVMLGR